MFDDEVELAKFKKAFKDWKLNGKYTWDDDYWCNDGYLGETEAYTLYWVATDNVSYLNLFLTEYGDIIVDWNFVGFGNGSDMKEFKRGEYDKVKEFINSLLDDFGF